MLSIFGIGAGASAAGGAGGAATLGALAVAGVSGALAAGAIAMATTQVAANVTQPNQTAANASSHVNAPTYAD